jgi:hypothetical protein
MALAKARATAVQARRREPEARLSWNAVMNLLQARGAVCSNGVPRESRRGGDYDACSPGNCLRVNFRFGRAKLEASRAHRTVGPFGEFDRAAESLAVNLALPNVS